MQFFDSCVWFGVLVFVSMFRSVVPLSESCSDAVYVAYLINFSDMPGAYGIIVVPVGFCCAV